jgi:Beta-propeller repeat
MNTRISEALHSLAAGPMLVAGSLLVAAPVLHAQELDWATSAGGPSSFAQGNGIATDPRGNSYVTGFFEGTATFGAGEAHETVLAAESSDVFVAKYNRHGALLWATSAGGTIVDRSNGIAMDFRGNSYVTGFFAGTATFGAGEANETVLEDAGGSDMFVAKYDRDGDLLWATSAGGPVVAQGTGIATDPRGNSYVTGFFAGTATFGAGEANETVLTSDSNDLFVAKYDRDGTLLWVTSASSVKGPKPLDPSPIFGIATDPRGNSYVTGLFQGTATFGAGEANETVLSAGGASLVDVFVAKYAPDGTLLWATSAGGPAPDTAFAIATDPRGNSYVTGAFAGTATFGAGEANETVLEADPSNVFVAKYDRDGALLWARTAGSISGNFGQGGIATDPRGNSYVSGSDSGNVFVAKYAPDGALLWVTSAGSPSSFAQGNDIARHPSGNTYVTGFFRGTATFGAGEANETVLEAVGVQDVFVAKYYGRA